MIMFLCVLLIINVVSSEIITLHPEKYHCGSEFTSDESAVYDVKYHYKSLDTSTLSGAMFDKEWRHINGTKFTEQLEVKGEFTGAIVAGTYALCVKNDNALLNSQVDIIEMSVEINDGATAVRSGIQLGEVLLILFVYIGIPVAIIAGITIFIYRRVKQREMTIIKRIILTDTHMDNYTNV